MNPYATAFSHLMNQYSSTPTPNGQGAAQSQAPQGTAPVVHGQIIHPAYQVYIPGAAQPHQYPQHQAYPYSYPTYPTYPMAMQSQYAVSANMPMAYGAPMVYPQAMPQGHMPQGQLPQQQHAQPQNNRPGNKNRPGNQNNKRPQPLQNSASVPTPSPVFPVTPAAAIAQPQTASVLPPAHPPVSTTHFCEACDKEFPNQSTYNSHCSTHEQCSYPGCSFTASKRVVQAHFHSTHGLYSGQGFKDIEVEGQSFRVLLGTSPEEVAQWRAERRKKFPSGAAGGGGGGGAETTSSSGGGHAPRTTTNSSTTGNQPPAKSQAALRREEWKQKKKQQQLERQHYKELRKAHHSRPSETDDGSPAGNATASSSTVAAGGGGAAEHRNFIQIHSSAGPTKGIEVISSTGTDEDPANVTSIRLSNTATDGTTQPPPAKRARFEKQPPKQRNQNQNQQQPQQQPKRERGSVLRKPDISGNLLTKLLQKEIYAEECLILATIRYLRQLYDPEYPQEPTTTTVSAGTATTGTAAAAAAVPTASLIEEVAATTTSSSSGLATVASPALAELLTKDIDELLAEVEAAEANGEDDDEDDEEHIGEREDGEEDDDDIDEEDDGHISDGDRDGDDNGDGDGDDEGLMGGIVRTGGNGGGVGGPAGGSRRKDEPQRLEVMDVEEDGRHPPAAAHRLPVQTHHHHHHRVAISHLPGMDEYASDNDNDNDNEEQEDGEIREG